MSQLWEAAEASLQTEVSLEVLAEASSIADAERARTRMIDTLSLTGARLSLACQGGVTVIGHVVSSGSDLVLVEHERQQLTGIAVSSLIRVSGVDHRLPQESPTAPLTWTRWLRSINNQKLGTVRIVTSDGWVTHGEIRYVGADFIRVAENRGGETDVMITSISAVTVSSVRLSE
ncbi:MAG: hypothetical protein Q7L55_09575 [Actinomycetota bacterium]|nr:hypothetical protein [Actinomycetota bacterium]